MDAVRCGQGVQVKMQRFNVTDLTLQQKRRIFVSSFAEGGFIGFDKQKVGDQTYYVFVYKN